MIAGAQHEVAAGSVADLGGLAQGQGQFAHRVTAARFISSAIIGARSPGRRPG